MTKYLFLFLFIPTFAFAQQLCINPTTEQVKGAKFVRDQHCLQLPEGRECPTVADYAETQIMSMVNEWVETYKENQANSVSIKRAFKDANDQQKCDALSAIGMSKANIESKLGITCN